MRQPTETINEQFMHAVTDGHLDVVQTLLDHGADIHIQHHDGSTALINAAERGHLHVIQLLLDRGADIHAQRRYTGETALMAAASSGHLDVIQLLLDRGADIHARSHLGWPALVWAAQRGRLDVVRFLLNLGADIHARDYYYGWTALRAATQEGHLETAEHLIRHGAQFEGLHLQGLPETGASDFSHHIAQGHIEEAEAELTAHPERLNQPNRFGQTPLMRAIICGQLGAVNWLIDRGANVDLQSEDGFTALYFAARAMLFHQHDHEETQGRYRTILETVFTHTANIDAHTQALMDAHPILDEMLNPGGFVLR